MKSTLLTMAFSPLELYLILCHFLVMLWRSPLLFQFLTHTKLFPTFPHALPSACQELTPQRLTLFLRGGGISIPRRDLAALVPTVPLAYPCSHHSVVLEQRNSFQGSVGRVPQRGSL